MKFKANGKTVDVDVPEDVPLLWVIREELGLGTKFGCGKAQCGACTVHVDGAPSITVMAMWLESSSGPTSRRSRRSTKLRIWRTPRCRR